MVRSKKASTPELLAFGQLLNDRRNAAGFSRMQLARKAKISDATVKFIEVAKHPPSKATLIRLVGVKELRLTWDETPGGFTPPKDFQVDTASAPLPANHNLNCFVIPTLDPIAMVVDLGTLLNGSGGHVLQSSAYLDLQSAAAYQSMLRQSPVLSRLRDATPLAEAARRIVGSSGLVDLTVVAFGAGGAALEVRLVQHLSNSKVPKIELCLVDLSQPLLACGQRHAAEVLTWAHNVYVWGIQCPFESLPLYSEVIHGADRHPQRTKVFCMLGGTFADLDHELRFIQHSLPQSSRGDMLLLDVQEARASSDKPAEIRTRDSKWRTGLSQYERAWLAGPIWRNCKDVVSVDFSWALDNHCPVRGSYSLDAMATVQMRAGAEKCFSMFRFRRYAPNELSASLATLGWDELGVFPFGDAEAPSSLRLYCKTT